jgi:broad specificity phosphatase PhoE
MKRSDIFLVRHGKPNCDRQGRLSRSAFVDWLACYAAAGVTHEPPHSAPCRAAAGTVQVIFASDLPRARDSAALLGSHLPVRTDAVFNEADIAVVPFSLSLRPGLWTAAGRLVWLAGAVTQESYSVAKIRAVRAAAILLAEAEVGSVLLVGHGWMNRMIAGVLVQHGMRRIEKTGSGYWSLARFSQCGMRIKR